MKFRLSFDTSSDAFGDNPDIRDAEIARILLHLHYKIDNQMPQTRFDFKVFDTNGNAIGTCRLGR